MKYHTLNLVAEKITTESFTEGEGFDEIFKKLNHIVDSHIHDLSTPKGRKETETLAKQINKLKNDMNKERLLITDNWREKTKKINAQGKQLDERFDALRETIIKPLNEWQQVESARVDKHKQAIDEIVAHGKQSVDIAVMKSSLSSLNSIILTEEEFEEFLDEATLVHGEAMETLKLSIEGEERRLAEKEELENFRALAVARKLEEEEAKRALKADEEKIAIKKTLLDEARKNADREAQLKIEAVKAEVERLKTEARDREIKIEQDAERVRADNAEKVRKQKEIEEDIEHQGVIKSATAKVFVSHFDLTEEKAKLIVSAIAAGTIPNITINY